MSRCSHVIFIDATNRERADDETWKMQLQYLERSTVQEKEGRLSSIIDPDN